MITELIGWIGVAAGVMVSMPQLVQSVKTKSTKGISIRTYQLLFLTVLCYLIRAIAIKEPVFIVSNSVNLIVTGAMLYLFKRYP